MTSKPRRILVDHRGEKGIGDIVCELNTYSALKAQDSDSLLFSRGSRNLAWGNPLIDAFDEHSPDEAFDQIIRFQTNAQHLKTSLAAGRTIFEHFLQTHHLPSVPAPPRLYALPEEVADLGLTPDHPDDLIIAYSVDSKEPDRRWGEERFSELLTYLQETYGGTYLELGSGFTAGHVGIGYDLVGQTDLRQTMALLSSADLFIGNHGGLTHLAGGVGTPILCPWGASTPYEAYAYDAISMVVESTPDCRHCGWTGQVHPECRAADVFSGRTPCTQEISVEQMMRAADELLPRLIAERDRLRAGREALRLAARHPNTLLRFESQDSLNPYANLRLYLGGFPGWGTENRSDDYARLRQIVAFPDWNNPLSAWESLIAAYVQAADAHSPWVLTLSAAPLAGPDINQLLSEYLNLLDHKGTFPKFMVILGALSESERRDLLRSADVYVPLEGAYHLDPAEPIQTLNPTQLPEFLRSERRQRDHLQSPGRLVAQRARAGDRFASEGARPHLLFTMFGWTEEGGGTLLPRQIAKNLVRRGYRVSVVYTPIQELPGKPGYHLERSQDEGVDLYALYNRPAVFYDTQNPGREVDDPVVRRLMAELLEELQPDLVHYHSFATFSMGIAETVERAGIPSLYTSHNYWPICPRMYLITKDLERCDGPSSDGRKCAACLGYPEQVDGYARRLEQGQEMLGRRVDRHLAVSHRVRELFVSNGHDPRRIRVLHQQPETVDLLWEEVGLLRPCGMEHSRPLRVGYFGSLAEHKGAHVFINALQRFDPTQIEAHVFGAGSAAYTQVLAHLDHKRMVQFHGQYEAAQLPDLLKQVDLVVIPSICDDCAPLVAVEALAARCPVIGSRLGGLPDFIDDGINGMLFEPGDASDLANAMEKFLVRPELLEMMQRAIHPPKGFSTYLDELEGHYRDVLAQRSSSPTVSIERPEGA